MDFTEAYEDRCSTVGSASKAGDAQALRELIGRGLSINIADNRGWFPVHEAAAAGHADCLEILVHNEGTDVDWQTFEGMTALYLAASAGYSEAVEVLLKAGASPDLANNEGGTPLYKACNHNQESCVRLLLDYKANVNSVSLNGWTPLHAAAYRGHPGITKKLLKAGGRIAAVDDHRITPTFVAAQYGRVECLKILIDAGGDVNAQALDGATSLYIAAQEGHTKCFRHLLESGADPNILTKDGFKPIHIAAEKNQLVLLELLLPASQLEYVSGASLWTPLHCTTVSGNIKAAKLLLNHGVDVNTGFTHSTKKIPKCDEVLSPLCHSYNQSNTELFGFLLSRGAHLRCEGQSADGCYVYHEFVNAKNNEAYDVNTMRNLVNCGLSIHCSCTSIIEYHLFVKRNSQLHFYKFLLDCGLKPKLECSVMCVCIFNLFHRVFIVPLIVKSISLAVCYVRFKSLCPGYVELLKLSAYWPHIRKYIEGPAPLQHLCRLAIRDILQPKGLHRMPQFVNQMGLPDIMKRYLLYEDGLTQMITSST